MGALPKRKISRVRRDRRRAHYLRLKMPNMVPCPQCGNLRVSHQVCPSCGTYNGEQVVDLDESAE
jgi:large subunit ribosomal protein L32